MRHGDGNLRALMERVIVWHRWSAPPEPSPEAIAAATSWRNAARDRFAQSGAELLFELGGSVAFALDVAHVVRAVELCMSALRDAKQDESAGGVACGITLGSIARSSATSAYVGDALDRAQVLANAAAAQEIMLDAAVRAEAAGAFLFEREVTFGDGPSAAVLDRNYPRKSDCQRALQKMTPPTLLHGGQPQLEPLRKLAALPGRQRALVIAPHGFGVSAWLAQFADELQPAAWLDLRAHGASLAPLSALMYALRRLPEALLPERVLCGESEREVSARAHLVAIREGDAVARREAIGAVRHYLGRIGEGGRRVLITVDPAPLVDPSSVGVVTEACRDAQLNVLAIVRTLLDAKPPTAFTRDGDLLELRLTELDKHEARALAASLLRVELPNDIARRAASLGGGTPLAVAEAVRGLVAAGDVIFEDGAFRWRRGPAGKLAALPLEALLEERIDGLAGPLRRALEVLTALPDPDDTALAVEVARANGLLEDTWARALEELAGLGFAAVTNQRAQLAAIVRLVLRSMSTPGRDRELHRSVAGALEHQPHAQGRFARANYAYYLAHAGRKAEAASILLDVAALAGQLGYLRSGVRLAAAAVESDSSQPTRTRAAQIAQRLAASQPTLAEGATRSTNTNLPAVSLKREASSDARPAPSSSVQGFAGEARNRAVEALLARDYDEIDRAIELLTAAGYDGASIERLRVVTLLIKGDFAGAHSLLGRLRTDDEGADGLRTPPQLTLTAALASLVTGEFKQAVRDGMEALARTLEAHDALGQRASLSVLSLCYRSLGRDADAARFANAAITGAIPGSTRLRGGEVGGSSST